MSFPTPDPTKILGVDTSHWTGIVDWQKAKANGIQFAVIKAMDGTTQTRYFVENLAGARAAGIPVGAYTWLYRSANISAGAQARAFAALLKQYPVDFAVVDFEWTKWGGVESNPDWNDLYGFVIPFESEYGKKPWIYTALGYWKQYGSTAAMWKQYPLWQAEYNTAPSPIQPWGDTRHVWQWTPSGDGVKYGQVALSADLNYYCGTQAEFSAEFGAPVVIVPDPDPVEPEPVITDVFYRVASELWPVTHAPLKKPPSRGPMTQTLSHTAKKAYEETPLNATWQNYIKKYNDDRGWKKIAAKDWGPSKGINGAGKLRYIGLVYPSNKSTNNIVKAVLKDGKPEISADGKWLHIESIPIDGSAKLNEISPKLTPWLFHKVCDNLGNAVSQNVTCPILGSPWWCELAALKRI